MARAHTLLRADRAAEIATSAESDRLVIRGPEDREAIAARSQLGYLTLANDADWLPCQLRAATDPIRPDRAFTAAVVTAA